MKAKPVPAEFAKFKEAMERLVAVPKAEVDRRAKEAKKDSKTGRYETGKGA
jgi:hypothetical protein